jgi:hypothetical protein
MTYALREERDQLRKHRVRLRKARDKLLQENALRGSTGTYIETQQQIQHLEQELAWSQKRWEELCLLLGDAHKLSGPVKLDATAQTRHRRYPVERRMSGGYITRQIRGDR